MRALIRIHIDGSDSMANLAKPGAARPNSASNNASPVAERGIAHLYPGIAKLFEDLHYTPLKTWEDGFENDKDIDEIFMFVPDDISRRERQHLVLKAYANQGQAHMAVVAINPDVLHIRIQ